MINIHHEPTDTSFKTETGNVSSDTPFVKTQIRTQYVDTSITRYDSEVVGVFSSQSIHLQASDDVHAEVVHSPERDDRYVVVRLDEHDTIFVPIEIASAITAAMLDEAIYAEEVA